VIYQYNFGYVQKHNIKKICDKISITINSENFPVLMSQTGCNISNEVLNTPIYGITTNGAKLGMQGSQLELKFFSRKKSSSQA
jgi:hypothetical protein